MTGNIFFEGGTKSKTRFFCIDLIPDTINEVLRYPVYIIHKKLTRIWRKDKMRPQFPARVVNDNGQKMFFIKCSMFYSILFLIVFRNKMGSSEMIENKASKNMDCHVINAVWLVRVLSVVPAWMYKHEGGATPSLKKKFDFKYTD